MAVRRVGPGQLQEFVFEGAIHNYPSPDVEKDNVNYLAGIQEIGVRSEYTDGRDMPQLLIKVHVHDFPHLHAAKPQRRGVNHNLNLNLSVAYFAANAALRLTWS